MPIPLIGGLLAKEAVKALPWRKIAIIGGSILIVLAVAIMAWRAVDAFRDAVADARAAGVKEGSNAVLARWQAANAAAARKNLQTVLENQRRQVDADRAHNERIAASLARVREAEGKIDVWRATPKAAVDCFDPDFVRVLERRRDAGNDPGRAAPAAPGR